MIEPRYLTALKQELSEIPPYIVFRNQLALPHTEPEKGARGVAMSLGIFKKKELLPKPVKLFILLCF